MVERGEQRGADVDIEGADILVAGGRGLGKAEGFELAEELAEAFGGNARWPRPARSSTPAGTRTRPRSARRARRSRRSCTWPPASPGAIQHKVGMQSSENIVAINKDANAPIFEFSDLGIVGDLNKILPKLTEAIKAKKGVASMASRNGTAPAPSEFPPPVDSVKEFIKRRARRRGRADRGRRRDRRRRHRRPRLRQPAAAAAGRRSRAAREPRRGAGRGDREGQDVRRAQPVRRGDAPRAAAGAVPRADPRGLAQGALRVRRGHQGGRLHASERRRRSCGSRRRRRTSRTTATRSSRSRRWRATSSGGRGGRRVRADRDLGDAADRRGRPRRRRALGRQGPRQGRRAARQLRARDRHQGARSRCSPRAAGATSPAPRSGSSTSPRTASRRSGSSASRRSGRSPSRSTA